MADQTQRKPNPFSEQGVSKYPPVAPLVGQRLTYERLEDLVEAMRDEVGSCFRAVFGDWGIGKTRLAHELVAEACDRSKGWIVRGEDGQVKTYRILEPLAQGGILPVFTTFADVLQSPEEGIDMRTALPKAACVALAGLAESRGKDYQVRMATDLQAAIRTITPGFDFEELSYRARDTELALDERARHAFAYLQQATTPAGRPAVRKLLVIIDEIETASEYTPANTAEERRVQEYPVETIDIKSLFSAVKEEAGQATLPHISYLLLCSPGVRTVSYIEASARRLKEAQLFKADGDELNLLLEALAQEGYLHDYPGELPRAAFLAADRNFGWFSYIMYPVYRLVLEGKAEGQDFEVLLQVSNRIGKIFKPSLIDGLSIADKLKDYLRRIVYHQLPASLQHLGIPESAREALLDYTDPYDIRVVGEVFPAKLDGDTLIRDLLATGKYREENATSTKLIGEASAPFEPRDLLAEFSTFEDPATKAILVYATPGEFSSQVRFLTSVDLTDLTIHTLHTIFEAHRLPGAAKWVGPTVTFLLKFNDRWASSGPRRWLADKQWEELEKDAKELNATQIRERVCLGVAKTLYDTKPEPQKVKGIRGAYVALKLSETDNLSVTPSSAAIILYAADTSIAIRDLAESAKNLRAPVLLIFPSEDRLRDWRQELAATHNQHLAVLAIPRVIELAGREHEFLVRYARRDEASGFNAAEVRERGLQQRGEYRQAWHQALNDWFSGLEEEGYVLRPVSEQNKYERFKQAYQYLAAGKNKDQIAALPVEGASQMRSAIDHVLMQIPSGNTLKLLADQSGSLYFPNVFARILDLLTTPRKREDLTNELIYRRPVGSGFNAPKSAHAVVEQILGLLAQIGLVEVVEDGKYAAVDAQRLGVLLTKARNQLGEFEPSPSNLVQTIKQLGPPFQQLAFKMRVNEAQLRLLSNELESARKQLPSLDLDSQKQVPAQQDAFLAVAGRANDLRQTATKVYRDQEASPPPVDPNTLPGNIDQIAADTAYTMFSVEYRVKFLQAIDKAVKEKQEALQRTVARLQSQVRSVYNQNDDQSTFPTGPIESLLDAAAQDLQGQKVALPVDLVTSDITANLSTYMLAGELDKAFQRLSLYSGWLSQTEPASIWNRFVHAYTQWQDVSRQAASLGQVWDQIAEYYDGDPDRQRWVSKELSDRQAELRARVSDFAKEFEDDYPSPRIQDLEDEVTTTGRDIAEVMEEAKGVLDKGKEEIREEIRRTPLSALARLAERLEEAQRVTDKLVWEQTRHIMQHSEVEELNRRVRERGAELLGDANLFTHYIEVYRDDQAGASPNAIVENHGRSVIESLHDKGALHLETRYVIDL